MASFGCASEPAAQTTSETTATPIGQSAGAEHAAAAEPLSGLWVEFWALEGHADTQRYALFDDGRFGWCAAREGQEQGARRWGRWSADGGMLVLTVQGEDAGASCSAAAGCRVAHDPPVEQRLPLGQCPPNEEAKSLDASYRCISIGGQAFWRRPQADDPAAYFPRP
jgi:hypothetical protein